MIPTLTSHPSLREFYSTCWVLKKVYDLAEEMMPCVHGSTTSLRGLGCIVLALGAIRLRSIVSGSKSYIQKDLRVSAVCQNEALIGWLTGVPEAHRGDQPSKSRAGEQFLRKSKYECVISLAVTICHEVTEWKGSNMDYFWRTWTPVPQSLLPPAWRLRNSEYPLTWISL